MNSLTDTDLIAVQVPNISFKEVFQIFLQLLFRNGEEISDCLETFDKCEVDKAEQLIETLQKKEIDIQLFLDKKLKKVSDYFMNIHLNLILTKRFFYSTIITIIIGQFLISVYFKDIIYQNVLNNFWWVSIIIGLIVYCYVFFFSASSIHAFLSYKKLYVIFTAAKAIYNQ